jgi:mycofactocin precursor
MPEMRTSSPTPATPELDPPVEVEVEVEVASAPEPAAELVEADLLVEDVSIDGMCGVY